MVGDLRKINEENKRDMSYEEVSNIFEGVSYLEINFNTGFNVDQL